LLIKNQTKNIKPLPQKIKNEILKDKRFAANKVKVSSKSKSS